jgi:YD repeat-containing protein
MAWRTNFLEMYGYTRTGRVEKKRVRVSRDLTNQYGQVVTVQRDLDGSWTYDGEGRVRDVTYPAGSSGAVAGTYTQGYNAMGQLNTLSGGLVTEVTYGPAGELKSITGQYWEGREYNSRLQLTGLNGTAFSYGPAATNNGRIQSEAQSGETVTYVYDELNRLASAMSNSGWGQGFEYDVFGNLTAKTALAGNVPTFSRAYDLNNRQVGLTFDANGNQLTDAAGVDTLRYDVGNRLNWARRGLSSPGYGYGYDPDNRRVYVSKWALSGGEWSLTSEEVVYYGVGGERMGTYGLTADLTNGMRLAATGYNVYFGGRLVRKVAGDGTMQTVTADRLGEFGNAIMLRADGKVTRCGSWETDGSLLRFTCDDTNFPKSAYPYVIDPTVQPPRLDASWCYGTAQNARPTTASTCGSGDYMLIDEGSPNGWNTTVANAEQYYHFDTTSIPANAIVSSATLNFMVGSSGYYTTPCYLKTYTTGATLPSWMGPNPATPDAINWVRVDHLWSPWGGAFGYSIPSGAISRANWTKFVNQLRCTSSEATPPAIPYEHAGGFSVLNGSSLSVTYSLPPSTITIGTTPAGRTFSVDGVTYSSTQVFTWAVGSQHTIAINTTTQAGGTGTQYLWTGWSDGGAASHTITTPAMNATYSASFTTQYYLTTSATVGGVIDPPSGWFNAGSGFFVTATPYIGYPFTGFSGSVNATTSPQNVYMDGPKSVLATFAPSYAYAYYYIDRLYAVTSSWTPNGTVAAGAAGLTSTAVNGGTLISTVAIPGGTNRGEVQAVVTLNAGGGTYTAYLAASSDAMAGPGVRGTFYALEAQNPTFANGVCTTTLALYRVVSGSVTTLGTTVAPCRNGMVLRAVKTATAVVGYADGVQYFRVTDSTASQAWGCARRRKETASRRRNSGLWTRWLRRPFPWRAWRYPRCRTG